MTVRNIEENFVGIYEYDMNTIEKVRKSLTILYNNDIISDDEYEEAYIELLNIKQRYINKEGL